MNLGSFRILLHFFFRTSWGVGVLNSAIFNSFDNWVEFVTILEGLRNFGGGGLNPPLSVRHCVPAQNSRGEVSIKFSEAPWYPVL